MTAGSVPKGSLLLALVGDVPKTAADVSLGIRAWDVVGVVETGGAAIECVSPATTEVRPWLLL